MAKLSDRFRGGLRVRSLKQTGLAAASGIQRDDILVGLHVWETVTNENLQFVLSEADLTAEKSIPFYVVRQRKTLSGSFDVTELR
jgi:serine protease Do